MPTCGEVSTPADVFVIVRPVTALPRPSSVPVNGEPTKARRAIVIVDRRDRRVGEAAGSHGIGERVPAGKADVHGVVKRREGAFERIGVAIDVEAAGRRAREADRAGGVERQVAGACAIGQVRRAAGAQADGRADVDAGSGHEREAAARARARRDRRIVFDVACGRQRQRVGAGPAQGVPDEDVAIAAARARAAEDGDVAGVQVRGQGRASDVAAAGGDGVVRRVDQPGPAAGVDARAVGDLHGVGGGLDEAARAVGLAGADGCRRPQRSRRGRPGTPCRPAFCTPVALMIPWVFPASA